MHNYYGSLRYIMNVYISRKRTLHIKEIRLF